MPDATTTISVRGEARNIVEPDFALVSTSIRLRNSDKQTALDRGGAAQQAVLDALRERGGQPFTVGSVDARLTWSTASFSAEEVHRPDDPARGTAGFQGWRVNVPIAVTLRDLPQLDDLARALAGIRQLHIDDVSWGVDSRNPAWRAVRTDAIRDSIEKARHYADALGGSLVRIEHVADTGLLGGREHLHEGVASVTYGLSRRTAGGRGGPSLDPVPQEIVAVIETRVSARVDAL